LDELFKINEYGHFRQSSDNWRRTSESDREAPKQVPTWHFQTPRPTLQSATFAREVLPAPTDNAEELARTPTH
jgi:hypothetical protein